ncbi:hypothetical protein QBC40DRAFT_193919 [Triangularia verruculosa]|uniref:Zn(2)-C6 fungal-type domain-containing protein n=1 Tax=Triangularia verruculosa TaxID=2587418 RepID=A0AAN6XMV0_9PEZI|nr:hypothetical protein QBC40DRAFT_193919 [Triangularia verruculosa]
MEASSSVMEGTTRVPVARYACESCKKRKTKCTRELPKCAACKPWPGPCNYSRQFPDAVAASSSPTTLQPASNNADSSLSARLDRIETMLQTLTVAVTKLIAASESNNITESKPGSSPSAAVAKPVIGTDKPCPPKPATTVIPPAISSLDEANTHLGSMLTTQSPPDHDQALALQNLSDLTDALTSFRLDMSLDLGPHDTRQYIIPDQQTGDEIIAKFTPLTLFASTFFHPPSPTLLTSILFSPSTSLPGWIIYVNYFLLSSPITASLFPHCIPHWRHNVRLALQNASLYLHPSRINIAAFTLLSFHGEDFAASPNTSWMLCSHLCRQAQALRLWEPATNNHDDDDEEREEERQRDLTLFWAIYNMEKCCALAFGRTQAGLEGVDVDTIEMPRWEWFKRFKPHLHERGFDEAKEVDTEFGGYIFLRNIELAKLTEKVLEFVGRAGDRNEEEREELKRRLGEWYRETDEMYERVIEKERGVFRSVRQERVMRLFGFTVKFRYLHVLIILTKGEVGGGEVRVESAREAIGILPMTVEGWDPVYNGVIWHLLYYPFTPFFVVFGHIVTNPKAPTVRSDLKLLQTVVEYIVALQPKLTLLRDLTVKLQKTAEIFLRLARRHVGEVSEPPLQADDVQLLPGFSETQSPQYSEQQMSTDQQEFSLDGIDVDRFLSWVPQPMGFPGDIDFGVAAENETAGEETGRGTKRPFEATFDWFSWENYYSDAI